MTYARRYNTPESTVRAERDDELRGIANTIKNALMQENETMARYVINRYMPEQDRDTLIGAFDRIGQEVQARE